MQAECESVLHHEIRLMKMPCKGLSYHTQPQPPSPLFEVCQTRPAVLKKCTLLHSVAVVAVTSSHNSRILVLMVKLLELAFQQPSQSLLRRIKRVAYDEDISFTAFQESGRPGLDEPTLRKLFVEFFHLTACDRHPSKVANGLSKYQVIRQGFVLMGKSVLHALVGSTEAAGPTLEVLVRTICKFFKVPFIEEEESVYKFGQGHFIAEDSQFVYKSSHSNTQPHYPITTDSHLLSSVSSIEEVADDKSERSIIRKLELTEQRSANYRHGRIASEATQEFLLNHQTGMAFEPPNEVREAPSNSKRLQSRGNITRQFIEVTPQRIHETHRSKSPVSINKPVSTPKGLSTKSPQPISRNRTTTQNCPILNRPFNNNYSFGMKAQQQPKVTAGPLRQLLGGKPQRSPLQVVPSLTFRGLLNRIV